MPHSHLAPARPFAPLSFIPLPCTNPQAHPLHRPNLKPNPKRPRPLHTTRPRATIRADLGPLRPEPTVPSDSTHIMHLQDALDNALDAELYTYAACLRDQLTLAKNKDCVQILSAHLSYYHALNEHSLERLSKLWVRNASVICQHPLSTCHVGYEEVMNGFATLFETLPADLVVEVSDVRIASFGPAAYVTCVERPRSSMLPVGRDGRERQHGLQATSVFEKQVREDGRYDYLMVHHVSAPIIGARSAR